MMRRALFLAVVLGVVAACATDPRVDRLAAEISPAAAANDIMILEPLPALFSSDPAIILSHSWRAIGPEPPGYSMTAAERLAFLCETVAPMVHAAGLDGIDVAWEEGSPHLSDCPPS